MGEVSFEYKVKSKHRLTQSFAYWFEETAKYEFAYQRFVALYDTRIFNSPVVITKVATGLPYISGEFAQHRQSFDMETFNGINIFKSSKFVRYPEKHTQLFLEKDGKSFIVRDDISVVLGNIDYGRIYGGMIGACHINPFSVYDNWSASLDDIVTEQHKNVIAKQDRLSIDIYANILAKYDIQSESVYDSVIANKPDIIANNKQDIAGEPNRTGFSIYQNYNGHKTSNEIIQLFDILCMPHSNTGIVNSIILGTPQRNAMTPIFSLPAKRIKDNKLVRYKVFNATSRDAVLNRNNMYLGNRKLYGFEVNEVYLFANVATPPSTYLNKDYLLYSEYFRAEKNNMYNTFTPIGGIELNNDYYAFNPIGNVEINSIHNAFKPIDTANVNRVNDVVKWDLYASLDCYLLYGCIDQRIGDSSQSVFLRELNKKQGLKSNDESVYAYPEIGSVNSYISSSKGSIKSYVVPNVCSVNLNQKYSGVLKEIWVNKTNSDISSQYDISGFRKLTGSNYTTGMLFARHADFNIYTLNLPFGYKNKNIVDQYKGNVSLKIDRKSVSVSKYNALFVSQDRISANLQPQLWVLKDRISAVVYSNQHRHIYRDRISIAICSHQYHIYQHRKGTELYSPYIFTNRIAKLLSLATDNFEIMAQKDIFNLFVQPKGVHIQKDSSSFLAQDTFVSLYKLLHGFNIDEQFSVTKTPSGVQAETTLKGVFKTRESFSIEQLVNTLYLKKRDVSCYDDAMSAFKNTVNAQNDGAISSAIKSITHIRLNNFGDGHNGLIIPVTKSYVDVSAFNNDIGKLAWKSDKSTVFTKDAMASILKKPAFLSSLNYLGAEKLYHEVMIEVYNYYAEKNAVRAFTQCNDSVYHLPYNAFTIKTATQSLKNSFFVNGVCSGTHGAKSEYDTAFYDRLMANTYKVEYDSDTYKKEFADKGKYGLYYFYDAYSEKTKKDVATLGELQWTIRPLQSGFYNIFPANRYDRDTEVFEPVVYGKVPTRDVDVMQQLAMIEKCRKEVEEFLSDFGNWVWVYETPSPFESEVYGIDELLLPEEDIRYEQFENIIFDKETMTPRDPVKILGPTSFIAKYPIEMPIDEFADVGAIYDDSAEKWEQYFGIETDVMRDIYLKYYQIWQAKIFEFSTMTMVQSTKKMLDYLYTWIDMYYPVDKMQQALRVFRQIRWYSESAVIRNSQYIISYEYDTLKSNLHTGICHVPNDLDDVTNPTMYVDKKNAVIRNNKALLGQDAHITFEIDVQKNTYIKFDLYTEYGKGTAFVYLNDVLVQVCTSASLGVVVQVPYTGSANRVTITKKGSGNVGEFYVGNISIPNATFKNLSIEFDPVLRAGNKPLEEVAKKMIACANLYADRNEMYAVIKKSSLGFSETYKQMNNYWKLHHQDKMKGKRLTIRQS